MHRVISFLCLFFCLSSALQAEPLEYEVEIQGIDEEKKVLSALQELAAQLKQQKMPPETVATLKKRAHQDAIKLKKLAYAFGYYSAEVHPEIGERPPKIIQAIFLGPRYAIRACSVTLASGESAHERAFLESLLKEALGRPITNTRIATKEAECISAMKAHGYPYARLVKKEITIDREDRSAAVAFTISLGTLARFGAPLFHGAPSLSPEFLAKTIAWNEGEPYDPQKIKETEANLEKTGLFSQVHIAEPGEPPEGKLLPLDVHLQEKKQRTISAGVNYTTTYGPGLIAEWEHRNLGGCAEKLWVKTELWRTLQSFTTGLIRPHWHVPNQNLILLLEGDIYRILAYKSASASMAALSERKFCPTFETLCGVRLQTLHSHTFEGTHAYNLLKTPMQLKWSSANSLLDPTDGNTLNVRLTPAYQFLPPCFSYLIHLSSLASYASFFHDTMTLAAKGTIGTITGPLRRTIPAPDRFLGGSGNALRGYRTNTVSPIYRHKIPLGGRSLVGLSLEMRLRFQDFGWVSFYDVGNVYATALPRPTHKLLQSIGTGIRYFTPIGPLRLDVAIPLDPRRGIDPHWQVYFSIGQAF